MIPRRSTSIAPHPPPQRAMPNTTTRPAQTTSEVKKQYKQHGAGLTTQQRAHLLRGHELDERAARHREAEARRRAAKDKRAERLRKEEAARQQIGIGLATQLVGYSHTQAQLKSGMEAFLGVKKKKDEEKKTREKEMARILGVGTGAGEVEVGTEVEAWDEDGVEDELLNLPDVGGEKQLGDETEDGLLDFVVDTGGEEQWADDDLDDDTLLEAHELVMSDPVEEPALGLHTPAILPPASASVPQTPTISDPGPTAVPSVSPTVSSPIPTTSPRPSIPIIPKPMATASSANAAPTIDEAAFARLHGPINRAIEAVLDKIPAPLFELLSQDISMRAPEWDPPANLLHKLSPIGVPPHRLRIKVGCVVTLLRDLNTSSQLSKSQHLRVLRIGNDRIECQVLDGQLEGTKAFLTRVPFCSKYRNEADYPFQRTQFPIRIATDYTSSSVLQDTPQSGFKLPSRTGQPQPTIARKTSSLPATKSVCRLNSNPSFKLPGNPASKAPSTPLRPIPTPNTSMLTISFGLDGWDDFLESGTQIARELSAETKPVPALSESTPTPTPANPITTPSVECMPPLSTQDLDFSLDDLDEEISKEPEAPKTREVAHPVKMPATVPPGLLSRSAQLRRSASAAARHQTYPQPKRKPDALPPRNVPLQPKKPCIQPEKAAQGAAKLVNPPPRNMSPPVVKQAPPAVHAAPQHKPPPAVKGQSSFSALGLSTQDAASFFDDEEDDYDYHDDDEDFDAVG
jgi:hypothetical protein